MSAGRVDESADTAGLFDAPSHPYTQSLLRSVPRLDVTRRERLEAIEGLPPDLDLLPKGCAYYPRCPFRMDRCLEEIPPLEPVAEGHLAACWASETVYQLAKGAQQR